jgi:biopolymer transport protein ExbD
MREEDQNLMTVCIRADKDTPMGTINEIKEALRKVYALKIVYAANQRSQY